MLQFANPHKVFLRAVLHFLPFLCNVGVSPDQQLLFITEFKMFRDFWFRLGLSVDLIVLPRADCAGVCPKVRRREKNNGIV